jgi:hypothetical protein
MKKLILTLFLTMTPLAVFAEQTDAVSLLLQEELSQSQPDRLTKYTLETHDLKILIFKVDNNEPPLNPLFFNIYFQCKSNQVFFKLNRAFSNSEEEALSYCGHDSFHIGTIQGEGNKQFLILPMKLDVNHTCPQRSNNIETFPIEEMKTKCNET